MSKITEAALEEQINSLQEDISHIQSKLKLLRQEVVAVETELVANKIECDNLREELRRFRLMYPSICKPPKGIKC